MRSMRFHILGCSGGLGGTPGTADRPGHPTRTSSFLVDHDILVDAGTGVEDLSVEDMRRIDHVFLTHSHLDHICALPLMLDTVGSSRERPVVVHALPETIQALKEHIFNWVIWPDFTEIPHFERPWMVYSPLQVGSPVQIGNRTIRPITAIGSTLPCVHTVFTIFTSSSGLTSVALVTFLALVAFVTPQLRKRDDILPITIHKLPLHLAIALA